MFDSLSYYHHREDLSLNGSLALLTYIHIGYVSQNIKCKFLIATYVFSLLSAFLYRILHTTSAVIIIVVMSKIIPTVVEITIITDSDLEFPVESTGVVVYLLSTATKVQGYQPYCMYMYIRSYMHKIMLEGNN